MTGCDEAFLVENAKALTVDETRGLMRTWAAYADPDADDRGYVEAADREHLEVLRSGDLYHLNGQLTVEHGQALKAALAAVTPVPAAGDSRSRGQRRAQALADLVRLALDHGLAGTGRAVRPRISVVVDYPTCTALTEAARAEASPTRDRGQCPDGTPTPPMVTPETLTGRAIAGGPQFEDGTPIPRLAMQRLACDSENQRIEFGPESEVLDVGRSHRIFTRVQRAAIVARDKHCAYPGCHAPPPSRNATMCSNGRATTHPRASTTEFCCAITIMIWSIAGRSPSTRRRNGWVFTDARGSAIRPDDGLVDDPATG